MSAPNSISARERITTTAFSLVLLVYGSYGVMNDFLLPGRRGWELQLEGAARWILCAAIACACLALLSVAARHRAFARIGTIVAWVLFCVSLIMPL